MVTCGKHFLWGAVCLLVGTLFVDAADRSRIIPPLFANAKINKSAIVSADIEKPQILQIYHRRQESQFESLPSIRHEAVRPRTVLVPLNDAGYRFGYPNRNSRYDMRSYSRTYYSMPGNNHGQFRRW